MVAGSLISREKQQTVLTLSEEGYNAKDIEKRVGISRRSIGRILERGSVKERNEYHKKTGRPRRVSRQDENKIKGIVKKDNRKTIPKIVSEMNKNFSRATVSRTLKRLDLGRRKMKTRPLLTQAHKTKRVDFALEHAGSKYDWSKWIFSDEKKFNLDGPDGYRYYWADLTSNEDVQIYSKDHNCRKNLMVWGAISKNGVSKLVEVNPKTKGPDYVEILKDGLILIYDDGDVFQHDGASCHRAKVTKKFLQENEIISPEWPPKSPDLSPIENLWGWLSRRIYAGKSAYKDVASLKSAIFQAWDEIPDDLLNTLIDSMPRRMKEVIEQRGNPIKY
jgi:transposase